MSFLGKYSCGNTTVPIYLSFSTAVCCTLISIVATVGNSFVVLTVFLNPNKDSQSPFNYLVVNLSIADLAVGLIIWLITAPLDAVYQCIISFKDSISLIKVFEERCVCLFDFLYCLDPKPVRPGARSVRRYYISSLFYRSQRNTRRSLLVAIGIWMVSAHSIIHDLFCSGLQ